MAKLTYVLLSEEEYEKVRESGILAAHNVGAKKKRIERLSYLLRHRECVRTRQENLLGWTAGGARTSVREHLAIHHFSFHGVADAYALVATERRATLCCYERPHKRARRVKS